MRKRQKGRGFRRALTEPVTRWFCLYAEAELSEEEELSWEDSALLEELSEAELSEAALELLAEDSLLEEDSASSGRGVPSSRRAPCRNRASWVSGEATPSAVNPLASWKRLTQSAVVAP